MPRRDWVPVVAIGGMIAFGGVFAVLVSDWTASRGVFEYHHPQYEKARAADAYCRPVKNAAPEGVDASKDRRSADGENPEHKEYDLCQQWRQAKAAEKAATYAALQAVAAVVSTLLLLVATAAAIYAALYAKHAARAGAVAAKQAQRGVGATITAVNATREGVVLAGLTAERQLRAYLAIVSVKFTNVAADQEPKAQLFIKNVGTTPAQYVRIEYKFILGQHPQAFPLTALQTHSGRNHLGILEPQTRFRMEPAVGFKLTANDMEAIGAGGRALYIVADTRYRDAFGKWCRYRRWAMFNKWNIENKHSEAHVCPLGNIYEYDVGEEA